MKHLTIGYVAYAEKTIEVSEQFYAEYIKASQQGDSDNYHKWQEIYQSILDIAKNMNATNIKIDESEPCCILDEDKEVIDEF